MKKQHEEEKPSNLLSLDDILSSSDSEYVDVEMPEWKRPDGTIGSVRLRTLTNEQLVEYTEAVAGENSKEGNLLLVLYSAVNADGSPLFTVNQLAKLRAKSAKAFTRLARAALDLNGVTQTKEVERAKNG